MRSGAKGIVAGIVGALLGTVVACSHSSAHRVMGPDGNHNWYIVRCRAEEDCYARAEEVCPGGYDVAEKSASNGYVIQHWGEGMTTIHPVEHGRMMIRCP